MDNVDSYANRRPIAFSFAFTLIHILIVIISAVLGNAIPGEAYRPYIGGMIGRLVFIAFLLAVLSRLGWLHPAGFRQPTRSRVWLVMLLPLLYAIAVSAYAMTGNFDFRVTNRNLTGVAALFIVSSAVLEEIVFRALVLYALVRAWGSSRAGIILGVIVSALFFGAMHMVNFLGGEPLVDVLFQSMMAISLGIILASSVLAAGSIYPAIVFHTLLNLAGYLNLTSNAATQNPSSWMLLSLYMVPVAVLGIYLLRGLPQRSVIRNLERI